MIEEEDVELDLSEEGPEGSRYPEEDEDHWEKLTDVSSSPTLGVPDDVLRKIRSSRMMNMTRLRSLPPVEWFIKDLIPAGPRTLIHGPGGSKKSFLLLDWMLCAVTGEPWHGRQVAPGQVLYIVGEGVSGIGKRVDAWLSAHPDVDPRLPGIAFMPSSINLFTLAGDNGEHERDLWARVFAALGVRYIVIDTVHQSMAGGEENSATDIGRVLEVASYLAGQGARENAADLFLVHHDPKATIGSSGPRGSSALRDSVDVCLTMEPHKTNNLLSMLKPDKVRDAEPFRTQYVTFGVHGEGISSSLFTKTVDSGEPTGEVKERLELSEEARVFLAWMRKNSRGSKRWTTKEFLVDACKGMATNRKEAGLRELCQSGLVVKINGLYQLAPNPTPAE